MYQQSNGTCRNLVTQKTSLLQKMSKRKRELCMYCISGHHNSDMVDGVGSAIMQGYLTKGTLCFHQLITGIQLLVHFLRSCVIFLSPVLLLTTPTLKINVNLGNMKVILNYITRYLQKMKLSAKVNKKNIH